MLRKVFCKNVCFEGNGKQNVQPSSTNELGENNVLWLQKGLNKSNIQEWDSTENNQCRTQ